MYKSQIEVFWGFVGDQSGSNGPDVVGLLAYSVFSYDLYKWVKLQHTRGINPTQDDIDLHIFEDFTDDYYKQIRERSLNAFDQSARIYLAGSILEAEINSQNSSVVNIVKQSNATVLAEMRKSGGFWRQVSLALITAIVAPLVLGVSIAAIYNYDKFFPTASWFAERTTPKDRSSESQ
jgi:hypothetical protein